MTTYTQTQLFAPAALTTSAVAYIAAIAAPSKYLINAKVRFTNITAGAITVTAYAVQSGDSPVDANAFMKAESIPANSHVDVPVPVLATGGTMQALASAGTSITISFLAGTLVA